VENLERKSDAFPVLKRCRKVCVEDVVQQPIRTL